MNSLTLLILSTVFTSVSCGAVGECRTECAEQNKYKIVRVHLKEDLVMAGLCSNTTNEEGTLSTVIPFICHRNHGIWTYDLTDEEGLAPFPVRCPPNDPVPPEQLQACPKSFA